MKVRVVLMVAIALIFGGATFAQEEKVELTGDYSFYRFNPGLPSLWNSQNLNGGGGQATYFLAVLFGGAHSNFYGSACRHVTGLCGSISPTNNAFAMAVGGGVDVAVTEKIAIRIVDADFQLTRFGNNFTNGNNSQSNFRFQTGVQFRF